MARTYLSVNILPEQQRFIQLLDEYEIDIFSTETINKQIGQEIEDLNEIVSNLVDKKFLSRIEKGKYCRTNFRDELVIGTFIAKDGAVAYWSALNRHGLTEQFSNTVFIQTPFLKRDKKIFGTSYKFVKIAARKRVGLIKEGYGNRSYSITDVDKTIVDCFDLTEYSGGYAELIRALNQAKLNADNLISYCRSVDNISVIKRIGFLAELLEKSDLVSFVEFAKRQVNKKYNLFDPLGSEKGEFISEWKLRMNISRDEIFDIVNKQY
jgi:predicted transcriptional regulator of viral defense system